MKDKIIEFVIGSLFSSTMLFGSTVAIAQYLQNNTDMIINLFGGEYAEVTGYILAIIIYALRLKTNETVVDKGAKILDRVMK